MEDDFRIFHWRRQLFFGVCCCRGSIWKQRERSDQLETAGWSQLCRLGTSAVTVPANGHVSRQIATGMPVLGGVRQIRTGLVKDSRAAPYATPRPRHSARAAARFCLKMAREERLRSALKWLVTEALLHKSA